MSDPFETREQNEESMNNDSDLLIIIDTRSNDGFSWNLHNKEFIAQQTK